jgi:hypothetical protein
VSQGSVCAESTSNAVTGFVDRCHIVQFVMEARLVLSQGLGIGVTELRERSRDRSR